MSKVDLARRGILGLRSLLKEAPAKNLPVFPGTRRLCLRCRPQPRHNR